MWSITRRSLGLRLRSGSYLFTACRRITRWCPFLLTPPGVTCECGTHNLAELECCCCRGRKINLLMIKPLDVVIPFSYIKGPFIYCLFLLDLFSSIPKRDHCFCSFYEFNYRRMAASWPVRVALRTLEGLEASPMTVKKGAVPRKDSARSWRGRIPADRMTLSQATVCSLPSAST